MTDAQIKTALLRNELCDAEDMRRAAELVLLEKLRVEAAMPEWYPHQ